MPDLTTPPRPRRKFKPYRIYNEQESRSIRRKKRALTSFVLSIVITVGATWAYIYYNSFFESTKNAKLATQTMPLTAKVSSKVVKFFVGESQSVKAGDPLVQLDAREFQKLLDQRQGELDRNEDRLKGGKVHLDRLQQKAASGDASARSQYEGARSWFVRLQVKTQEMRQAVAEAKEQVDSTVLKAPSDGHLGPKTADVGASVQAGQPIVQFVGTGLPWSIANFREEQLDKMKLGQKAEIIVPSLGKVFTGKVELMPPHSAAPIVKSDLERFVRRFFDSSTRVPVRIAVDSSSVGKEVNRLVNGTPAEVKVYIQK